jgi:uncharacterized protein YqfB (UPF0267 family)
MDFSQITKLPYAGVSKRDGHVENSLFRMSDEQNQAADQIEFMRSKRQKYSGVAAGVPNLGLHVRKKNQKYKYEPPYGYGGNLSTNVSFERINRNPQPGAMQDQYYNFMDQISLPMRNPSSKSQQRPGYNGRPPIRTFEEKFTPDPNLSIKPIENNIGADAHHGGKKKPTLMGNYDPPRLQTTPKNHSRSYQTAGPSDALDEKLADDMKKFFLVDDTERSSQPKMKMQVSRNKHNLSVANTNIANTYSSKQYNPEDRHVKNRSMNLDEMRHNRQSLGQQIMNSKASQHQLSKPMQNMQQYNSQNPYDGSAFVKKRSAQPM